MKSPFPGMDPFIEASRYWDDFHGHLIEAISAGLADSAPPGYFVLTGRRDYLEVVEQEGKKRHPFIPDVSVKSRKPRPKPGKGTAAVAESMEGPITLRAFVTERHRERFIEIHHGATEPRLVTAIEVLSPANKSAGSDGQALYLRKRESLLLGGAHLVEIDLLRNGTRMPMLDPWPDSPYVLMVARVGHDHECSVYRGAHDRPLPSLPVPLLEPDPDLSIDLQPMVDAIYRRSRYAELLDYSRRLTPPLAAADKALLAAGLKARKA